MTQIKSNRSVVSLVEGAHGDVKVARLDGDQFMVTVQQAITACSIFDQSVQFDRQFGELLNLLYDWVEERKHRVSAAFISIDRSCITLVIVQKDVPADFELGDELVNLDLEIANSGDFSLVPFNTLLLPKVHSSMLQSFLPSEEGRVLPHGVNHAQP